MSAQIRNAAQLSNVSASACNFSVLAKLNDCDSSKPSVLIVGPTPPPAHGIAVFTLALLGSDLRSSFRIVHLDTSDRRTLANIGRLELRNVTLAIWHGLRFGWLLLAEEPDLVYMPVASTTLGFLRDSLFLASARLFRRSLVVQLHGGGLDSMYAESNSVFRWWMRFCLSHATRAIVLSEYFRQHFDGLLPLDHVRVVPVGIAPGIWETAQMIGREQKNHKKTILYLSSLVESKGFWDLLQAVPYVLQETRDVEFLFAGDTSLPEARAAREWVREHRLESFIKFLGPKWGKEKTQIFLEADIFAFPTRYPLEGQPAVLLEAMAAGLAVITTRHATIPDMLGEEGALYVRKQDPKDIADKVCRLLQNHDLRRDMGRKNQDRFLRCYTLECLSQNMRATFEEALCAT